MLNADGMSMLNMFYEYMSSQTKRATKRANYHVSYLSTCITCSPVHGDEAIYSFVSGKHGMVLLAALRQKTRNRNTSSHFHH